MACRLGSQFFNASPNTEPCHGLAFDAEEEVVGLKAYLLAIFEVVGERGEGFFA